MREGFRQAMAWLHTWAGLLFGWLLFAIFLTGSLTYFRQELNRWAHPEVLYQQAGTPESLASAQAFLEKHAPGAPNWLIIAADERLPVLTLYYRQTSESGRGSLVETVVDPRSGEAVQARDSRGGEFFYRFHYELEMGYPWGRWLASLAAFVMFVTLVSGIITHKKLFKDFFTFRPGKGQRSWLDGHNALGVLALPFHLMITYSSLVIFMTMTMPASILSRYDGNTRAFFNELFPATAGMGDTAQRQAPMLPLPALYARYLALVPGGQVGMVSVDKPGTASATATFTPKVGARVAYLPGGGVTLNAVDGSVVRGLAAEPVPQRVAGGFYGMHMGRFAGPVLRWLYFISGLAATAMIGTGLVMWLGKRLLKHAGATVQPFELRVVGALNLAGMVGLVCAVAAFLCANRLLPLALAGRASWEVRVFFLVWLASLLHALWRPNGAGWLQQLSAAAAMLLSVPVLSQFATSRGLAVTLPQGDWAVAGVDLACAGFGLVLAWLARRVWRRALQARAEQAPPRAVRIKREAH
ncbi:PepSY-associated TM helix domain-containing protein [Pseudomonas typographi]|uniref:PepSY domain-containing protein n=1 Tax=Pseudomonas typographi TaxID=2715964 RepID=A0ABR7YYL8_9PSED|nr:PepSY-associated TM helix domain-containing protein [Pseudomonas typographi]MBD1598292.1 PepSY domain-containing protein [Pseudomonas typographi]